MKTINKIIFSEAELKEIFEPKTGKKIKSFHFSHKNKTMSLDVE